MKGGFEGSKNFSGAHRRLKSSYAVLHSTMDSNIPNGLTIFVRFSEPLGHIRVGTFVRDACASSRVSVQCSRRKTYLCGIEIVNAPTARGIRPVFGQDSSDRINRLFA
jgi:hypothetical protein